jgi:ribosomal protein S18 acetylase RimI-like enzyme
MTTINIEEIRKTKKNEPKVFPSILTVDREAFGKLDDQVYILKSFWQSSESKIILAKKSDTQSIIGYASYLEMDGGCYLMRIAVRGKCQRHGVGRKIMNYLFEKYPKYLSLDVSTDN